VPRLGGGLICIITNVGFHSFVVCGEVCRRVVGWLLGVVGRRGVVWPARFGAEGIGEDFGGRLFC